MTSSDKGVPNQARFAAADWPVVHCLADSSLGAAMAFTSIIAVILSIKGSSTHCNGGAVVVSVASFRLALATCFTVVRIAHEGVSAATFGDMILRPANTVLSAQSGCATHEAASNAVVVNAADLIISTIAIAATFWSWCAALTAVVGDALKANPAFAGRPVVGCDAVCIGATPPVQTGVRAILDAYPG